MTKRLWTRTGLAILSATLGTALVVAYWGAQPEVRGAATAERIELMTAESTFVVLPHAFLMAGDTAHPIEDMVLWLADSVHLEFIRIAPDTLDIGVDGHGKHPGCLGPTADACEFELPHKVFFKVVLPSNPVRGRFFYAFSTSSLGVGTISAPRTGLSAILLSGNVAVLDRTVSGDTFTSASRPLAAGEQLTAITARGAAPGKGIILAAPGQDMTVSFNICSAMAEITRRTGDQVDTLATPRFARVRNDWIISWLAVVAVYLLIQPVAELLRNRVKTRLEEHLPRHKNVD